IALMLPSGPVAISGLAETRLAGLISTTSDGGFVGSLALTAGVGVIDPATHSAEAQAMKMLNVNLCFIAHPQCLLSRLQEERLINQILPPEGGTTNDGYCSGNFRMNAAMDLICSSVNFSFHAGIMPLPLVMESKRF